MQPNEDKATTTTTTTTTSTAPALSPEAACAAMNRLMIACRADLSVQKAAAATVQNLHARDDLLLRCKRRDAFITELASEIRVLGGTPGKRATLFGDLWGALRRARYFLIGDNDGDAFATCADVETTTEKKYAAARNRHFPNGCDEVIARQHDEIERDRINLRRARHGDYHPS